MTDDSVRVVDREQVSNGAGATVADGAPYAVLVTVVGVSPILLHAWNIEAVQAKSDAAKGSRAKKSDDLESYVIRNRTGHIGLPGVNFRAALIQAGRYRQDPRSSRKTMIDLLKACLVSTIDVAAFLPLRTTWDYEDKRRVLVQRSAITRTRPALREGWKLEFALHVLLPQYVPLTMLRDLVQDAGRFCGLGDHRPSYGRFALDGVEVVD